MIIEPQLANIKKAIHETRCIKTNRKSRLLRERERERYLRQQKHVVKKKIPSYIKFVCYKRDKKKHFLKTYINMKICRGTKKKKYF